MSKLLEAHHGDHPVGADHVPEPSQVKLASHASVLFKAGLKVKVIQVGQVRQIRQVGQVRRVRQVRQVRQVRRVRQKRHVRQSKHRFRIVDQDLQSE